MRRILLRGEAHERRELSVGQVLCRGTGGTRAQL